MYGSTKWNGKKKSLGHISAEFGIQKNISKILLQSKPSKLENQLSAALLATVSAKSLQLTKNSKKVKTLGELFFSQSNDSQEDENGQTQITQTSAQSIVCHNKAASLLRVAIAEGGGITDPKRNLRLSAAIKRAKQIGVPQVTLQQIIRKSKLITEARPVSLIQIRYQRKVYIVCTVLTRSQSEFQLQLMPTLKPHFAGFAPVLSFFNSHTYIEAIVPMNIGGDFRNIQANVQRDGLVCGATDAKPADYETGLFRFRVDPQIAADVAAGLLTKGYQIINIAYEFKAKRQIDLNVQEREAYNNFLWKLRQVPEIDSIFDNVKKSVATKMDFDT